MTLISFTTQKYYERSSDTPVQQMCYQYALQLFPNLVSKLYLDDANFDKNKRTDIQHMIELIKSSFDQLLEENNWMDPVTKKIAKEKLTAIHPNVAAPGIVFDEKSLEKDSAEVSYFCNFFTNRIHLLVW